MTLDEALAVIENMRKRKVDRASQARADAERLFAVAPAQENMIRAAFAHESADRCMRYAAAIENECDAIRVVTEAASRMLTPH